MRKLLPLLVVLAAALAFAQAATRPVIGTWNTPTGATGFNVFSCAIAPPATSCTPVVTGTPVNASPLTNPTITIQETVGVAYGYSVVALYPACGPTSPLTTPCGTSGPSSPTVVPVPPQGQSVSTTTWTAP
jgi:hypothetical protein